MLARTVAPSAIVTFVSITSACIVVCAVLPKVKRAMDHPKVEAKADVLSIRPKNVVLRMIVPYMTFHPTTRS